MLFSHDVEALLKYFNTCFPYTQTLEFEKSDRAFSSLRIGPSLNFKLLLASSKNQCNLTALNIHSVVTLFPVKPVLNDH